MAEEKKVLNEEIKKEVKKENKLFVERETFIGKDEQEYFGYVLKGKVRDRDVKVDFAPKDVGGYEVLDIVFSVNPKAELVITNEEMESSITGKVTKFVSYKVVTFDADGVPYECGVKPRQDSDKSLLKMLLNQLGVANNG